MQGRALDTGDFAGGQFHDGGIETALVGPAQVHAQQHIGPVLRLGAAGTGLNIEIGVVGVHFAAEHPAELELFENTAQTLDFGCHVRHRAFIAFFSRHVEQVARIGQAAVQVIQGVDDQRQRGALTPQILCVFRVIPDVWIFELAVYFD
jgi:hypothetical protein